MAIFLCLGAGMLLLAFWGGRAVADRLASVEDWLSQTMLRLVAAWDALCSLRFPVGASLLGMTPSSRSVTPSMGK